MTRERARHRSCSRQFDLTDAGGRLVRTYSRRHAPAPRPAPRSSRARRSLFLDEPTTGLDIRSRLSPMGVDRDAGRRRHDRPPHHAVPGRGRPARRADRRDRPRRGHRRGYAERAQGAGRRRAARGPRHAAARTPRRPARFSPRIADDCAVRRRRLGVACRSRERRGTIAEAVRRLDEAGIAIDDIFATQRPTLDDVFLQLTGHDGGARVDAEEDAVPVNALAYELSDMLRAGRRAAAKRIRAPARPADRLHRPAAASSCCCSSTSSEARSQTPGFDYVDFLMPGILVQTIAFGGFVTAIELSDDLTKGLMDRFRSLPMARSAVLAARTLASPHERRAARRRPGASDSRRRRTSPSASRRRGSIEPILCRLPSAARRRRQAFGGLPSRERVRVHRSCFRSIENGAERSCLRGEAAVDVALLREQLGLHDDLAA